MSFKRALSVKNVLEYSPEVLDFKGAWKDSIGLPELTGSWIIWGNSAQGKTRYALQLAKYLSEFRRVAYDSIEEGLSLSMQHAIIETGMSEASRRFIFLDKESIQDLRKRLRSKTKNCPEVIIIDSLQYSGLKYNEYKSLRDEFNNKLFIFISHAEGKEPKGAVARSVRYDAFVKIYVEGYKAFIQSRYGGGKDYEIWEEGANQYWKEK